MTSTDPVLLHAALDVASILATNNHSREMILDNGGLHVIVTLLTTLKPSAMTIQIDLIELAVSCVRRLIFPPLSDTPEPSSAAVVAKIFGSRLLLALMKAYPERENMVCDLCRLIAATMKHEKNSALVARLDGGIILLVKILGSCASSETLIAAMSLAASVAALALATVLPRSAASIGERS